LTETDWIETSKTERAPLIFEGGIVDPQLRGPLSVWQEPTQRRKYVIGADTAEGLRDGDWSVAEVVEMETCEQVAELRVKRAPVEFARMCVRLARWYNGACLAFETGTSAHGLSAQQAAQAYGYGNFYMRRVIDSIAYTTLEKLGWATTVKSKPMLVDRVREAIAGEDPCIIRSEVLLTELKSVRYVQRQSSGALRVEGKPHDDCFMGYGIALMVRDELYHRGVGHASTDRVLTPTERMWQDYHDKYDEPKTDGQHSLEDDSWDGC
jgi:hypothetical protein